MRTICCIACFIITLYIGYVHIYPQYLSWRHKQAAEKGINWIILHADELDPRDAVAYLKKIYKVVESEKSAQDIYQTIQKTRKSIHNSATSLDPKLTSQPTWEDNISPIVQEINRRKCRGDNVDSAINNLQEALLNNSVTVFPEYMSDVNKYIVRYSLSEIGISTDSFFHRPTCKKIISHNRDIYCHTHNIIITSGYYDAYVNPNKFIEEQNILRSVLINNKDALNDDATLDVTTQVVTSLKLMKVPVDSLIQSIQNSTIDVQNTDGSWGKDTHITSQKIHMTTSAILSLLQFRPQLRKEKVFCY